MINFKAECVFIKGIEFYDSQAKGLIDMDQSQLNDLISYCGVNFT